jgi:hypothetical protein
MSIRRREFIAVAASAPGSTLADSQSGLIEEFDAVDFESGAHRLEIATLAPFGA